MNLANGEKTQDLGNLPAPSSPSSDQICLLKETEAKDQKAVKMQRLQHVLFSFIVLALLTLSVRCSFANNVPQRNAAPALPPALVSDIETEDPSAKEFRELLNTIEPASLHEVLHKHLKDKYKHGVYQEDKKAMEVVHQQNAEVAESLVELAKRQGAASTNGSSVVNTTPAGTTAVTTAVTVTSGGTTTIPASSTLVVVTSTSTAPQSTQTSTSVQTSTEASSHTTTSQAVSTSPASTHAGTTTTSPLSVSTTTPDTKTSTTTKNGSPNTSGPSSASPTTQASPSNSAATSTTQTSTSEGSRPSTTDESKSSITQSVVYKTTLANGAVNTVTSITVVPAAQQGENAGSGSKTNTADASLQTNGGRQNTFGLNFVVGALCLAAVVVL